MPRNTTTIVLPTNNLRLWAGLRKYPQRSELEIRSPSVIYTDERGVGRRLLPFDVLNLPLTYSVSPEQRRGHNGEVGMFEGGLESLIEPPPAI